MSFGPGDVQEGFVDGEGFEEGVYWPRMSMTLSDISE